MMDNLYKASLEALRDKSRLTLLFMKVYDRYDLNLKHQEYIRTGSYLDSCLCDTALGEPTTILAQKPDEIKN